MQGDDILKAELKQAIAECERLRAENSQLKARLGDSAKIPTTPARPLVTSQIQRKKLPETRYCQVKQQIVQDSEGCSIIRR